MAEFSKFGGPDGGGEKVKVTDRSSNGTLYVDYKRADDLRRYMTPNGKIQGRKRSGLTAREQRLVAAAIKRSRYMGLLPYTSATL